MSQVIFGQVTDFDCCALSMQSDRVLDSCRMRPPPFCSHKAMAISAARSDTLYQRSTPDDLAAGSAPGVDLFAPFMWLQRLLSTDAALSDSPLSAEPPFAVPREATHRPRACLGACTRQLLSELSSRSSWPPKPPIVLETSFIHGGPHH
jgi:hypothetical protein